MTSQLMFTAVLAQKRFSVPEYINGSGRIVSDSEAIAPAAQQPPFSL
jgi:hypothetical protein